MPFANGNAALRQTLRQACRDLEERLRADNTCRAEEILTAHPELNQSPDHAVDVVLAEFQIRRHLGEDPDPEEYLRRFRPFREQLIEFFEEFEHSASEDTVLEGPEEDRSGEDGEDDEFPFPLTLAMEDGSGSWKVQNYEVLEDLPNAGVVAVYKARHLPNGGLVALKILPKAFTHADEATRFRRGRDDQARLKHPNIVAVYDKGESDEAIYFAMEFGEAGTLTDRIGDKPMPADETARIMHALAEAMDYAHAQKIIHRDLKPANVVLTADGTPKITDFGLARRQEPDTVQSHATVPGDLHGTPAYMAPEQTWADSQYVSERTDVFGLGAILYQMLTGRVPFEGANLIETVLKVRNQPAIFPRRHHRAADRRLESVCLKCLEKRQRFRYTSVARLQEDLQRYRVGQWPRAHGPMGRVSRFCRRHGVIMAAALLSVVTIVAVVVDHHLRHPQRHLDRHLANLRDGKPIVLVPERGPPGWLRYAPETVSVSKSDDLPFRITSKEYGAVELLPETAHPYFEVAAEFNHDFSENPFPGLRGKLGVYFGYRKLRGAPPGACYLQIFLNDIPGAARAENRVRLDSICCQLDWRQRKRQWLANTFTSGRPPPGAWRKLVVRVTPMGIEFELNDQDTTCSGFASTEDIRKLMRKQFEQNKLDIQDYDLAPGNGIGLIISEGSATLRNVTLKPLEFLPHP